jgi:HEAT repeat protein
VRMRALEALRDVAGEADVRDVLLQSLNRDSNPGVRVEAVNLLVRSLELESARQVPEMPDSPDADMPVIAPSAPAVEMAAPDASVGRVVRALEDLQHRDPNRYVRLRSAAALRQIGPADVQ